MKSDKSEEKFTPVPDASKTNFIKVKELTDRSYLWWTDFTNKRFFIIVTKSWYIEKSFFNGKVYSELKLPEGGVHDHFVQAVCWILLLCISIVYFRNTCIWNNTIQWHWMCSCFMNIRRAHYIFSHAFLLNKTLLYV